MAAMAAKRQEHRMRAARRRCQRTRRDQLGALAVGVGADGSLVGDRKHTERVH